MSEKKKIQPLDRNEIQVYIDNTTQLTHIVKDIAGQIGPSQVIISTYSTSEQFVRAVYRLVKSGLIKSIILIADLKAARKTLKLHRFMLNVFTDVRLTENHSKIVLMANDRYTVSVITSQNQTRGNRTEAGVITTNKSVYVTLESYLRHIVEHKSLSLHEIIRRTDSTD